MASPAPNLTKPFTIGGFIVGELYMLFTVLAPNLQGTTVPIGAMIKRVIGFGIFFGPFGAAAGLGIGLLLGGLLSTLRKDRPSTPKVKDTPVS